MARQSLQRTNPPSTGPRHRRYRVLGTLPALLLLAGGAYLGVAFGNWILLDGAVLYLLIAVVMIATDTPPRRPLDAPPDTFAAQTDNDAANKDGADTAPTRVPVAAAASPTDRTPTRP